MRLAWTQGAVAGIDHSDLLQWFVRHLRKIVAAELLEKWVRVAWYGGDACPAPRRTALRLYERAQDRKRQIHVTLRSSREPVGRATARNTIRLRRRRCGDLPLRQFQIDQRKRYIRPGSRPNESFDLHLLPSLSDRRKAAARLSDHLRHELCRYGVRAAEPIIEFVGITMSWKARHGIILHRIRPRMVYGRELSPYSQDGQNAIRKRDGEKPRKITGP
jgi:hypothetical protein